MPTLCDPYDMLPNDADRAMEELLSELPFDLSPDARERTRRTAEELAATADGLLDDPETNAAPHVPGDDPHGALLACYENPRTTESDGPLVGLQVAVKDNLAARGLPMTCGSDRFDYVPSFDASVVERLLDAGASLVGKANMDAFAFGPSGEFSGVIDVTNPIDAERVPGGSSSGSGAAVAAGTVDVALGTDTGGSVRVPAACCGVVGAKPTHGVVPRYGLAEFAPSLDTIGPLARDVETCARVLDALLGEDRRDPTSRRWTEGSVVPEEEPPAPAFGLPDSFYDLCDSAVAEAVREAVEAVPGATVRRVDLDPGAVEEAYYLVGATEFSWLLRQQATTRGQGVGYDETWRRAFADLEGSFASHAAERVSPSALLDATAEGRPYVAARREALAFERRLSAALDGVDAIVVPTIRTLPPKRGRVSASEGLGALLGNTSPFNLADTPAVTVPVAEREGLPISAQVVAPRFEDGTALEAARALEAAAA